MLRAHTKTCMVPHHMPKFYLKKIISIGEKFTLTQKKGIPMPIIGPFTLYCKTMTQVHHGKVSWNLQILGKQYVGF